MTTTGATDVVREILAVMERGFAASDATEIRELMAEDVLFLGGSVTAEGKTQAAAYIDASVRLIDRMEWAADQCWIVHADAATQVAVAIGEMHRPNGDITPYRLTLALTAGDDGWRITHFHGSTVPE